VIKIAAAVRLRGLRSKAAAGLGLQLTIHQVKRAAALVGWSGLIVKPRAASFRSIQYLVAGRRAIESPQ
jgi:hypothetical protein